MFNIFIHDSPRVEDETHFITHCNEGDIESARSMLEAAGSAETRRRLANLVAQTGATWWGWDFEPVLHAAIEKNNRELAGKIQL